MRQFSWEHGRDNVMVIHLTLVPYLKSAGELKTKPTQHSVKTLSEAGIQADMVVCRSEQELPEDIKEKIGRFCNVEFGNVISARDADSIYEVPLLMKEQKLDERVLHRLKLESNQDTNLEKWKAFLHQLKNPTSEVTIGLVGKYVELHDAYKSIAEAFIHAGAYNECKVNIVWIHSEEMTSDNIYRKLHKLDAILVAPGFGQRGIEGKINTIKFARENEIPFFGICLGMQCAVIEFARNVMGLRDASSREMYENTPHAVIDLMNEQKKITRKGGTMRLGAYPCQLKEGSIAFEAYGKEIISERHRHRYEFNNEYLEDFNKHGMKATGLNPNSGLVEIVEIENHPHFIGAQFHPELKSTVANPHPLFISFVKAAIKYSKSKENITAS